MSDRGGRIVLTTGANSGLGLAIAVELARRGFTSIGSVRSAAKAATVRTAADAAGVEVHTVQCDVDDASACARAIATIEDHHGALHGLVNNAGYSLTGAVEDVPDEDARAILETMVVAPMRLSRLALPAMREAGGGRIVNISSIYGRTTTPFTGWYQAAKHALEGVSDALRMEVASDGIVVTLVEPGLFRTNIFEDVAKDVERWGTESRYRSQYQRSLRTMQMSGPLQGNPERVARLVGRILDAPARLVQARYLVGADAQSMALAARVVPTPIRDLVTRAAFGL
jgi:NAD(P)-dependent dehydrogenase (short-subunit alcohol dehydrogenase family)